MYEVKCNRDFHGRLFPHAKEGDTKTMAWGELQQLLSEAPTHFQWRKLPEVETPTHENEQANDHKQDSDDQPAPAETKGKAKGKGKKD